jgi:uncharacterized membrane protein YgcG
VKRLKKLLLAAVAAALLLVCLPGTAFAGDYYDIVSDDIHIVVSESNGATVTETLVLDFTYPGHGFYYSVQYKGTGYYYMNGEWKPAKFLQRVYDFDVAGYEFDLSRTSYDDGSRYLEAKIGSADQIVTGRQTYVITYKVDLGDNARSDFDEFYRNLIYCEYGYTIPSASFTIDLPRDFDDSLVRATMGEYGSTDTSGVTWEKDGSRIVGRTLRAMQGGETLTLRAEFPDDYFTGETDPYAVWNYAAYAVSGACVLLALLLWLLLGRDYKIYPTVEFYAPDGMTPAEAGYVIDGEVDDKDVVALLLYWADKGFLRIVEHERDDFELVKLKDLTEGRSYEKHMFGKLFAGRDSVSVHSLKQTFYDTMVHTKNGVKLWFDSAKERNVFTKSSKKARKSMGYITMLPIAFTLFMYSLRDSGDFIIPLMIALFFGWVLSLPVFLLVGLFEKWRSTPPGKRIARLVTYSVVLLILFAFYIFAVPAIFTVAFDFAAVAITLVSVAATLIMLPLAVIMRKRTQQGAQWYGKLLGFRNFIDKAEKDRIEKLVEENPSYFYNVLPYAYVLGVTDIWARKFEDIGVAPPQWYSGYPGGRMFSTLVFTSYITRSMGGFTSAMVSRPPSTGGGSGGGGGFSGGGGFGGGGFSGGGFGGGGARGGW